MSEAQREREKAIEYSGLQSLKTVVVKTKMNFAQFTTQYSARGTKMQT